MRRPARLREGTGEPFVGPWGLGGPLRIGGLPPVAAAAGKAASPQQGVDYSGTNVQEAGRRRARPREDERQDALRARERQPRSGRRHGARSRGSLDTLKLDALDHELLLYGDRLLVLSRGGYWAEPLPALAARMIAVRAVAVGPHRGRRLRTRGAPPRAHAHARRRLRRRAARRRQPPASSSTSQMPGALPFEPPADARTPSAPPRAAHNRAVLASSRRRRAGCRRTGSSARAHAAAKPHALVQCRHVRRPRRLLRPRHADRAHGRPRQGPRAGRLGRGDDRRPDRLRVAGRASTSRPSAGPTGPTRPRRRQSRRAASRPRSTSSTSRARRRRVYRGSGKVPGYLLSQWSLSEYRGVLRVVSTETPAWWGRAGDDESFLTTLRQQDGALSRSAGSAGSARASASTPSASSATSATSSRSGRSTRSTRSTSPTRSSRACSAS